MNKQLSRTAQTPTAPVRLIHLGLGAFHRAHQVWYTQHSEADPQHPEWGYASFTGRGPKLANLLAPQQGLYHLVTRSEEGDNTELMTSLVAVHPADDIAALVDYVCDPQVAVLTLTVTEAGYYLGEDGVLDTNHPDIAGDLHALRESMTATAAPATACAKIVLALNARKQSCDRGMAVMSCDNVADNGRRTRASVVGFARALDDELAEWIEQKVSFPSTSIDRITPATSDDVIADVAKLTGFNDAAPVVTEPFRSWVIEGDFPAGRPSWERAGAQFVTDIELFERRKLWLLNGSHSLMAYYGQLRGHATVADAITDPVIRTRVEALWDEAANHLTDPDLRIPSYREELIQRFQNSRIRHNLAQIAIDGATKQRMRAVAIMRAEREAGRSGAAAAFSIAAWISFVLRNADIADSRAGDIAAAGGTIPGLLAVLDSELAADPESLTLVTKLVEQISQS